MRRDRWLPFGSCCQPGSGDGGTSAASDTGQALGSSAGAGHMNRHVGCGRPVAVTRTRTPPPARGHGQHTRRTCHTGSVGIDTAPSGRSQHVLGVVGRDSKDQRIHQKRHIPGCDEMGVELDDGKLEFFKPSFLTKVCRVTARRQCLGGSS